MTKNKPKFQVPIRTAKPKGDMFNNLRKPEQVESLSIEEIIGSPAQRTETPASTPAATPVITPVATPAKPPVVDDSVERDEGASRSPAFLDATHTASEARIYSVMYRQTVSKGARERHFGPKELCEKTGIRSDRTIRTAIDGLIAKLSIEIVSHINGNPLGPRYRIYEPKEIVKRRRAIGMEIDPQSKKIVTPVTTPVATPVTTGDKTYRGTGVETTGVTPAKSTGVSNKYINDNLDQGFSASSSSKSEVETLSDSDDDGAFLDSIREVYERATGNTWTTADAITAQKGREISKDIWSIAICYCVDRAPGHTFQRLSYVLEQAKEHAEEMKGYSKQDLRAIARHSLSLTERARATGKWTLAEIENEEGKGRVGSSGQEKNPES